MDPDEQKLVNFAISDNRLLFIDVDTPTVKEEKPAEATNQSKLSCIECKFTAGTSDKLTRHIRTKHRGQKPFQCDTCDYSTTNKVMHEEHMNNHRGIKPYKCTHCSYRSVSKKYIKMHELRHGTCKICGFRAKNKRALAKHQQESNCLKHEPGPHACENCNMSFESTEKLQNHKRYHRRCTQCEKSFIPELLEQHIKSFHLGVPQSSYKFQCKICEWKSNVDRKILLHLIHHPEQEVSEVIDITPLVKSGILVGHC